MIPPETTSKEQTDMSTAGGSARSGRRRQPGALAARRRQEGRPRRQREGPERLLRPTQHAIKGVTIDFPANEVTALIGPSGSGKSTVVRCINRMHEEIPGARAEGSVMLDELDVYSPGRRRHGGAPADRDGVPEAESVPDDVDLRQRRRRAAADRHQEPATCASWSTARCRRSVCGTRSRTA